MSEVKKRNGPIRLTFKTKIEAKKIVSTLLNNKPFGIFVATQWHKLYSDYVPKDTGQLASNVKIEPFLITHKVRYSKSVYYDNHSNFRKDKNPKATSFWDKKAEPARKRLLVKSIQNYLNFRNF